MLNDRIVEVVGDKSWESFKELVQRATNLWPDAPAEIKEFADKVTNKGKVQQKYSDTPKASFVHYHRCSCGGVTACTTTNIRTPEYGITCNQPVTVRWTTINEEKEVVEHSKVVTCGKQEPFNHYSPSLGAEHV